VQFSAHALDLPEIQSLDLHEIVEDKVRRAYDVIQAPVIVEDVSAGLDALQGLPGPFFKFFEKTLGRRTLLLLSKEAQPRVTITCIAAYYDGTTMVFGEGYIKGHAEEPRGTNGFGFDFTVVPDGETRTMAEMTPEEKNAISHRGQAMRNLLAQL
jgi:non-canonical purine NTP pyrophosphatase (RdgB/HAM1 family)